MDLPFITRNCLKRLYREGSYFKKLSRQLDVNFTCTSAELERYHNRHLTKMIHYCYTRVPYYTDLLRQMRLTPDDFRTINDLQKLPFLDKKTVNENFDKLTARNYPRSFLKTAYTSGSTGTPSRFLRDYHAINFEHAAICRYRKRAERPGRKRVIIRGDLVTPVFQSRPPFWKCDPLNLELAMSSYHLSPQNSKFYVEKILEFQPDSMVAFPTTALLLARYFRAHGVQYNLDAVYTSSECLEPFLKNYVEETFRTKVYDWYGQAERVAALGQCSHGNYHIEEDYSLVELLDTENGCELVGTQLHNFAMPLLRYRTGDMVLPRQSPCPCGHSWRAVGQIVGRSPGVLITPEGNPIVCAPAFVFKGLESILEAQFYQERHGEVIIRVLSKDGLSREDRESLLSNTLKYTSPHMRVRIMEVPRIERGPNGKFLSIVNHCTSLHEVS